MITKVRKEKPIEKPDDDIRPSLSQFLPQKVGTKWSVGADSTQKSNKSHRFMGFHERLQKIDVKLSHNPDKIPLLGLLNEQIPQNEDELLVSKDSAFIEALSMHNMMNLTLGYQEISKILAPLSTTFPMVVNNLDKIVHAILEKLGTVDQDCNEALLDFIIGLIKDTRELIFPIFLKEVMPKLISMIKVEKVELLDKAFTVFSYAFKFLQRQIVNNLKDVYACYYELLAHSNKYVRKFASESFCYVLRIFKRSQLNSVLTILLDPLLHTENYLILENADNTLKSEKLQISDFESILAKNTDDIEKILENLLKRDRVLENKNVLKYKETNLIIIAISQLLAEIMMGTQGNPHSKALDFMSGMLNMIEQHEEIWVEIVYICRYAMILLIDYLEVEKDQIIMDSIKISMKTLVFDIFFINQKEQVFPIKSEFYLSIVMILFKDWISLYQGKKISNKSATEILSKISVLLTENQTIFNKLSKQTAKNIIQTLAILYNTKFELCKEICQLNFVPNPTISSEKLLFTKTIFNLSNQMLICDFLRIIFNGYDSNLNISQFVGDYTFNKNCLNITTNEEKQKMLLYPLYENIIQNTQITESCQNQKLLFLIKVSNILNQPLKFNKETVICIYKILNKNEFWINLQADKAEIIVKNSNDLYECLLFIDIISREFNKENLQIIDIDLYAKIIKNLTKIISTKRNNIEKLNKNYTDFTEENYSEYFVFNQYLNSNINFCILILSKLAQILSNFPKFYNDLLSMFTEIMQNHRKNPNLLDSLLFLFNQIKQNSSEIPDIFTSDFKLINLNLLTKNVISNNFTKIYQFLQSNLCSNLHSVRLKSLKIISANFEDPEKCGIMRMLLKFEESEIGLETEREKAMLARDMKILLSSGKCDKMCLISCLYFTFGCIWNKFSPIHEMAEDIFETIISTYTKTYGKLLLDIYLNLLKNLFGISAKFLNCDSVLFSDILSKSMLADSNFSNECKEIYMNNEEYTELKNTVQNSLKFLRKIMRVSPEICIPIIDFIHEFIECEYNKYFSEFDTHSDNKMTDILLMDDQKLLSEMLKTNIKNDEDLVIKELKLMAKIKMQGFMEILSESDSEITKQIPAEKILIIKNICYQMLSNSDEKIQKYSIDTMLKINCEIVMKNYKMLQNLASNVKNKELLPTIDLSKFLPSEKTVFFHS